MIKIIISSIPILTLGYIIYDFFMRRYKKKKDLELQKIEFMRLLGVQPNNVGSATHTVNISIFNPIHNIDTTFTVWFKESISGEGFHSFYNPIDGRWEAHCSLHYVPIILARSGKRFMEGCNGFNLLIGSIIKLPTLRPTKKLKKHKLTD